MAPKKQPRNTLGRTAKYYRDNPAARKRKQKTDKKINARPEQRRKRVELMQRLRKDKKRGIDTSNKDYDHAVGRRVSIKTNRGRTGEGARKRKKR